MDGLICRAMGDECIRDWIGRDMRTFLLFRQAVMDYR